MTSDKSGNCPLRHLELEEEMDEINPFRHLMVEEFTSIDAILPSQPPSIQETRVQISVVGKTDNDRVAVQLVIDASPGCGGITWPAGEVLSSYLVQRGISALQGKTVLELGSGTGLVGLVAGFLGAKVWITDQSPLLGIMDRNVEMNGLSSSVTVSELNWGDPIPYDLPRPDLIVAADCVYFEPAFPLLVKTLAELVPDESVEVLFCYKKRRKADKRFFTLLKKEFTWTEVVDDKNRSTYSREGISLFRLLRK